MFTVPASIRRIEAPPPLNPPTFVGPVLVPDVTVNTTLVHQMYQYFSSGDAVSSYALTNNGGATWLTLDTNTGELGGTAPASPETVTGVIVTATNAAGSTPTDAFNIEVVAVSGLEGIMIINAL
jgi:hypothetical protein